MSRLTCQQCGAPIPAQPPLGLCPACLLKNGLEHGSATQFPTGGSLNPALEVTLDHTPRSATVSPSPERVLPEPGQRFGGYYILRTLGKGGMGAVYEADQLETGRRVALKVLKHSLDSPEARKRFLREGRLAASVNHPNSVYVFGTEEIDGTPAITMELIAGGTLQERVKQYGPLPIGTAVDTVLQIIAGLDAAQKVGILHRDIKPANCFIDTDGGVKIGDFGLSISTGPRGDTDLTQAGTLLGTPAFSSPEQLRGDELNMRSDIYSVGVTLYYLLTGRTPFEADNIVKLLATVLERPAESPRKWRPEIPRPLASVVLRCLEKQPANRFRDYEALREALLPFASAAPSPATLGLRLVASAIDGIVMWFVTMLLNILMTWTYLPDFEDLPDFEQVHSRWQVHGWWAAWIIVPLLLRIAYYGVPEGLWGFSIGKAICRLRVIGLDRAAPGIPRAIARAAIILVGERIPTFLYQVFLLQAAGGIDINPRQPSFWLFAVGLMIWGPLWGMSLFITARRRNGYAGLHDLITGTRVISREAYQVRAALVHPEEVAAVSEATPRIGPYHVLQTLSQRNGEQWVLGYDTRLLRRVWIHKLPDGAPSVEASLRGIGRIGRLRWLAGRRSVAEHWDAYEAASGQPFVSILNRRQPWSDVRFWLLDLAEELAAGFREGTVPAQLALDRIWITDEGRAKLLDFPAPGIADLPDDVGQTSPTTGENAVTQQFLGQVAVAALEGRIIRTAETKSCVPAMPLPLSARDFFKSLPALSALEPAVQTLRELVRRPGKTSSARRLSLLLACCLPPLAIGAIFMLTLVVGRLTLQKYSDLQPMFVYLMALEDLKHGPQESTASSPLKGTPEEIAALECYISHRFGKIFQDRALMSGVPKNWRTLAQEAVAAHPSVTETEFHAAEKIIEPLKLKFETDGKFQNSIYRPQALMGVVVGVLISWLALVAICSLTAAIACRGGLFLWALGLAVVRDDGAPASRLRVLWRMLIAWSPVLLAPFAVAFGLPAVQILLPDHRSYAVIAASASPLAVYGLLVVWSALLPGRGIPDRLAGTWLVPR